jgi:hypothetical protein
MSELIKRSKEGKRLVLAPAAAAAAAACPFSPFSRSASTNSVEEVAAASRSSSHRMQLQMKPYSYRKPLLFLNFFDICPEPVLANVNGV